MSYTYKNIVDSLPKKKNSNSSWWVKLWIRKMSFPFTYLFINLGFSPNAVSVFSVFVVLVACVCFCVPNGTAVAVAVILTNLWLVLDCVDGNIARCRKQKTVYGEFVDDIGGYYIEAFVYLAVAVCAFNRGGVFIAPGCSWVIVVGAVSSIANILSRLIHKDYANFSVNAEQSVRKEDSGENRRSLSYIRKRVGKEIGISGAFMPAIIVAAVFNAFDLVSAFYFLYNCFAILSTTVIYIYKADKYDKTHKN